MKKELTVQCCCEVLVIEAFGLGNVSKDIFVVSINTSDWSGRKFLVLPWQISSLREFGDISVVKIRCMSTPIIFCSNRAKLVGF